MLYYSTVISFEREFNMSKLKMLAIDLGASSGRGIVGAFDGKKFEINENHRFPNEPVNTWKLRL